MKFKFGDKVKVISGFYVGLKGTIDSVQNGGEYTWNKYSVYLTVPHSQRILPRINRDISENELELIERRGFS